MKFQRPRLTPPPAPGTALLDWLTVAGVVAASAIALHAWLVLPEIIPVHFGIDGRANGWGSKGVIWMLPGIALLVAVQLTLLRRIPHTFNYAVRITADNAQRQYQIACTLLTWMRTELVWLMVYIAWQMHGLGAGGPASLGLGFVPVLLLTLFGTLGYFLYQSYRAR